MHGTVKVKDAVEQARPVVERLARDDELHKHVKNAYESARHIYDELFLDASPKAIATRIAQDKSLQKELRQAVEELREVGKRVKTKPSHRKRNTLLLAGITLGLLYNPATGPETRRRLKEKLFGPEETFEYEP